MVEDLRLNESRITHQGAQGRGAVVIDITWRNWPMWIIRISWANSMK